MARDDERALILGGRDDENAAATTLEAARSVVQQLRLDLDMAELFVPGVRRGYATLPFQARSGESEAQLQERLRGAITRVREAKVLTGAVGPMGQKRLWVNFSSPPEKRRRNVLVGKLKRAILEAGGVKSNIEAEFAAGPRGVDRRPL